MTTQQIELIKQSFPGVVAKTISGGEASLR